MKRNHAIRPCPITSSLLFLALSSLLTLAADYPSTVSSLNPLAYWRFNETNQSPALNKSANSGTAAPLGDGYVVLDVVKGEPGIVGNCIRLNNTNDDLGYCGSKVDVPFNAAFNPPAPFSAEVWIKPNTISSDSVGFCPLSSINPEDQGGANRAGYLFYVGSGGSVQWRLGFTGGYAAVVTNTSTAAVSTGAWSHVVGTFDGTTANLYINGVLAGTATASSPWVPNSQMALRLGGTALTGSLSDSDLNISGTDIAGNRGWDGWVDEVAIYPTLLTASQVAAHHDAATTNNAGYHAQIAADNPVGYWQLEEPNATAQIPPTFPIAANTGSAGTDADGTNMWGTLADQPGVPFAGFGSGNKAVFFNGESGFVGLKDASELHWASGTITMLAWIKPTAFDYFRNIICNGWSTNYAETFLRISRSDDNTGTGTAFNWYEVGSSDGTNYSSALFQMPSGDIGNWVFLAGTYDGANWNLYRNGNLVASKPATVGHVDTPFRWSIGSRTGPSPTLPGGTQDPEVAFEAVGLFFGGLIDEPAIFSTALTAVDILNLYNSSQPSPTITQGLQNPGTAYKGSSVSFYITADGSQPLVYSWTSNGTPVSVNTTNYTASNLAPGTDTIQVVVNNAFGSATSSVTFVVVAAPPNFVQQPQPVSRFAGRPFSFSVAVSGTVPMSLQWRTNGVAIPGATSSNYTGIASAALNGVLFSCTASNEVKSSTNSASAALTVIAVPSGYGGVVVGDGPVAYWRLGEKSGSVAHDYYNGHDGVYYNAALGQPGYSPFDPDTGVAFGGVNSYVGNISGTTAPGINFSGHTNFSLEAWVNAPAGQADQATIIAKGVGPNGTTATEQFALDVNGSTGAYRFFTRGNGNTIFSAEAVSGPNGTWQHIVGVYDDLNALGGGANMYIYVNGQLEGTGTTSTNANGLRTSSNPVSIGSKRTGNSPDYDGTFNGTVDEVAVYPYALSASQVLNHYCNQFGTTQAPLLVIEPQSATNWVGWPVTLTFEAAGSCTLGYQWYKGGNPVTDDPNHIIGSTTATLLFTNTVASDAGSYSCLVTNSLGATNTPSVMAMFLNPPTNAIPIPNLVMHLTFDNTLADATGRGNNGTGQYHTSGGTIAMAPAANPSVNPNFCYTDGVLGQGLHYSTDGGPPHQTNKTVLGTNDFYVNLGVRPDLKFGSNVDFTVALWVRLPVGYDGGDLPFFCDATNSTFGHGFTLAPSYGTNGIFAGSGPSGAWAWSLNSVGEYGPDQSINPGLQFLNATYRHLVYVFHRSGNAAIYLDGERVSAANEIAGAPFLAGVTNINNPNAACIGQDPTGAYPETGSADIDDLGVWRRALTEIEARGIYVGATNGQSFVDITPAITIGPGPGQITVIWQAGTLQSATSASGPYADVPGAASPYTVGATARTFYRVRYPKWN